MNPCVNHVHDKIWFDHAWKTMTNNINDKTVNHAHIDVRSAIMNHALSRIKSHVLDKLR